MSIYKIKPMKKNITLKSLMEGLYGENVDQPSQEVKLTSEQKQAITDMVANYNEYGKFLSRDKKLPEIASKIAEIARHAETLMMSETGDWFDKQTVSKNSKEMKKSADDFGKIAQEAHLLEQRMTAAYEDMGHFLSRYFNINDITESIGTLKKSTPPPTAGASPIYKKPASSPSSAPSDITPATR
jgi:hypothetical protein